MFLNLQICKGHNSINTYIIQENIFNLTKSTVMMLEMKPLRFKCIFINTCRDNCIFTVSKMKTLGGQHFGADLGQLAP